MKKQSTLELINALKQMLSKNSDRFTTEEVESLEMIIVTLKKLQNLEENENKEPDKEKEIRCAIKIELVKVAGFLLRFFLNLGFLENFGDFLN